MSTESIKYNQTIQDERWDTCEHLQIGDKSSVVFCEDDSFGPVLRNALCEECGEKALQAHNERLEQCHECSKEVPIKDIQTFKPYDFHAPSGDEPTLLCKECWDSPEWVLKREQDRLDLQRELGEDDLEDDWDEDYPDEDIYWDEDDEEWRAG